MTASRYRLGAEELIELGDSGIEVTVVDRKPFLSGRLRRSVTLGQAAKPDFMDTLSSVSKDLAESLSTALNVMSSVMNVPIQALGQSVDTTKKAAVGLLDSCPTMSKVIGQVLLLGGSLVKYGLSTPDLALQGLTTILAGLAQAMEEKLSSEFIGTAITDARTDILAKADPSKKAAIEAVLDASGVSVSSLAPSVGANGQPTAQPAGTSGALPSAPSAAGTGLETALAVGTVGAVALVTALVAK